MSILLNGETHAGELVVEPLEIGCAPAALLKTLTDQQDPIFLDSAGFDRRYGRFSVLTANPLEVLTLRDGRLSDGNGKILASDDEALWSTLSRALSRFSIRNPQPDLRNPYAPGWFGYLGYELNRHVEHLPARSVRYCDLPDLRLGFYDAILVYDALDRRWSLVKFRFDSPPPGAGRAAAALGEIISAASGSSEEYYPIAAESADARVRPIDLPKGDFTPDEYRSAVARCKEYIAAGDVFQVCLSQRFTCTEAPDPLSIYSALRRRSPAWYGAYMGFENSGQKISILSSSPELFLRIRGDRVITRPIKGTRPRVGVDREDKPSVGDLLASPKDNAELAMIVDLLRNDLGRVCRFGTVRVTEPRRLETHPTVFHLVGTVEGRLRDNVGPAELIRATFPGGSITGAPKIRAMEIIDELEPVTRGIYTGCIGFVGVNGCAEWNIAIRTMICESACAHIHVGGGIVADSDPELEYIETLAKARAMLEAVGEARQSASCLIDKPPQRDDNLVHEASRSHEDEGCTGGDVS